MKGSDSLQRRARTVPQSSGKRITLQPRDWLWLKKLNEHGPLPSSFLLEYCKDTHRSEKRSQERLTDLFNENHTFDDGTYLSRPAKQFATLDSRYNRLVYDLTKASRKALKREGVFNQKGTVKSGAWVHRLMVSCITASIELACHERVDVNFIPGSLILQRADTDLRWPVSFTPTAATPSITKELIPDALFGLEYVSDGGSKYRFFIVEADRSTEPASTNNFKRKSFLCSLLQYQAYAEGGAYRKHLGLTAPLLVLHVTPDEKRIQKMLAVTAKHFPAGNSYMLFQSWEDFGPIFKPPKPKPDLLNGLWQRSGMEALSIDAPY